MPNNSSRGRPSRQAIQPREWTGHGLITLTELRHVHQLALTPVGDVFPIPKRGIEKARARFASTTSNRFRAV